VRQRFRDRKPNAGRAFIMEQYVAKLSEIPDRGCKLTVVDDVEVGVFRIDGRVVAYRNLCLHQGGPVCEGIVLGKVEEIVQPDLSISGRRFSDSEIHIVCPWHGWEYDLATGAHAGDRRLHLRSYPVVVRGEDVYVDIEG
jgi:nitrite reductase (NADH) small subunit